MASSPVLGNCPDWIIDTDEVIEWESDECPHGPNVKSSTNSTGKKLP